MITKNSSACKLASTKSVNFFDIASSNIAPQVWYHGLALECGKADAKIIAILSELVFLHRLHGNTEFQLNFEYFPKKFNFGLSKVKDIIEQYCFLENYQLGGVSV